MAFQIIRNDITRVAADAIVNTANPQPTYGGGTDAAIYAAAGAQELLRERKKKGPMATGEAWASPAFALPARYIIHTVGPAWIDGSHGEREAVRQCYENSLVLARELGCESIAFPLIATGIYGFPRAEALQIAMTVFSRFLSEWDMRIILVVFDEESFVLSGKIFTGIEEYIDRHYVEERTEAEYDLSESRLSQGSDLAASYPQGRKEGTGKEDRRRKPRILSGRLHRRNEAPSCFEEADLSVEEAARPLGRMDLFPGKVAPPVGAPTSVFSEESSIKKKKARSLSDLVAQVGETWQESLFRLIDEKGYTDTEVYKRANVDRKLFSKIRGNVSYQPKKRTAVAFALALRLSLDETRDLLSRAGYALSPCSKFDLIVEYFIDQGLYDMYTINLALFDHRQPLLGE